MRLERDLEEGAALAARVRRAGVPPQAASQWDLHVCRDEGCRGAAVAAYCELRARGLSDQDAFRSIVALFQASHRSASPRDAAVQVTQWLTDDRAARGRGWMVAACGPSS